MFLVFVGGPRLAVAAALSCGTRPEISPGAVAKQVNSDAEEKTTLILNAPPNADLRGLVTVQRRELQHKYGSVDSLALDHYLLWTTCRTISSDPMLAGSQKFDAYSNVYRLLSEPIDKATPAAD